MPNNAHLKEKFISFNQFFLLDAIDKMDYMEAMNTLRFSASLSFLFQELPIFERIHAAKECGFQGIEFSSPYNADPKEIRNELKRTNMEFVLLSAPAGKSGEKGIAALPHRKKECKESIELALAYANELDCKKINVLSGILPATEDYALYLETYIENLRDAAQRVAPYEITLMIEPFCRRVFPGYLIETIEQAKEVIKRVNEKNVAILFDCFHIQSTEGNLATRFLENIDLIQHVHIAGVPGRHEPMLGEINYSYLFDIIKKSSYAGWIGCEYIPIGKTKEGLEWLGIIQK